MSLLRYVLPALAVVGSASASCSVAATTTIQNAGDASALASCTTFTGSIAIATGTSDDIALNSIEVIEGDLVANNVTQLTSLSGDSLSSISGAFTLQSVQILSTLDFPRLASVDSISWGALPNLQTLSFKTGIQNASSVDIENTGLQSLTGLDLGAIETFTIVNNGALQQISLNTTSVTQALNIAANGDDLITSFPNLIWASNMTLRNIASISLPKLQSVNGSFGIFESDPLTSVTANNFTSAGGSVSIIDNENLANISFPALTTVGGGFQIQENPKLTGTLSFPDLQTVTGALDFYGNFTDVELAALADVKGAFNLQSSGDISSDCTHFSGIKGRNAVIRGPFQCIAKTSNPEGAGSTATSSGSTTSKTAAANALDVSSAAVMGLSGVLAAVFGLL